MDDCAVMSATTAVTLNDASSARPLGITHRRAERVRLAPRTIMLSSLTSGLGWCCSPRRQAMESSLGGRTVPYTLTSINRCRQNYSGGMESPLFNRLRADDSCAMW